MTCSHCGGYVEWKGPLSALTHTECESCGSVNSQIPDGMELSYFCEEDEE